MTQYNSWMNCVSATKNRENVVVIMDTQEKKITFRRRRVLIFADEISYSLMQMTYRIMWRLSLYLKWSFLLSLETIDFQIDNIYMYRWRVNRMTWYHETDCSGSLSLANDLNYFHNEGKYISMFSKMNSGRQWLSCFTDAQCCSSWKLAGHTTAGLCQFIQLCFRNVLMQTSHYKREDIKVSDDLRYSSIISRPNDQCQCYPYLHYIFLVGKDPFTFLRRTMKWLSGGMEIYIASMSWGMFNFHTAYEIM